MEYKMHKIDKEIFTSEFSRRRDNSSDDCSNRIIYDILPEYGSGSFVLYQILDGMYVSYCNINIDNTLINQTHKVFNEPVLKFHYCLNGSCISRCPGDKIYCIQKENTGYFIGVDNFNEIEFLTDYYHSLSIFCYLKDICESIDVFLNKTEEKLKEFYRVHHKRDHYLCINTPIKISQIINQLIALIKENQPNMIKIRAIELLLQEIEHYDEYLQYERRIAKAETIEKIEAAKFFIEHNLQKHLTIEELAFKFSLNETDLKKYFKLLYGLGPYAYLRQYRLQKAKDLLIRTEKSILEIANSVGYANPSKFSCAFKRVFGLSPLKYRKLQQL